MSNELKSWLVGLPELALGTFNNLFQILLILILTIFFAVSCQSFLRQTISSWLPNGSQILQLLNQNFHRYLG
jgi:predicted PurR-regulated permease PerM